jgi:hypothetical protein
MWVVSYDGRMIAAFTYKRDAEDWLAKQLAWPSRPRPSNARYLWRVERVIELHASYPCSRPSAV